MKLRHLNIFITVCEHQNMTLAAKALYLSQPSVSQAISELESFYDVKLFERLNRRLYITSAGEKLLYYARHITNLTEQAKKELSEFGTSGTLRVGASLTIGTYLLPKLITTFREQMPTIELFTVVDNTNVIEHMLLKDEIDIGLVEGPVHSPNLIEQYIQTDHLVLIASPKHPISQKANHTAADLQGLRFIVREAGSGTRLIFENSMQAAGISWEIAGWYHSTETIKQAVRANLGLAVVPQISIEEDLKMGWVVLLDVQDIQLTRKFNFIYHKQKFFTPAMDHLVSLINAKQKIIESGNL